MVEVRGRVLLGAMIAVWVGAWAQGAVNAQDLPSLEEASGSRCAEPRDWSSCSYYSACIEAKHACEGTRSPYAVSFGEFYCKRFTARATDWTSAGKRWVSEVMICLQEQLVPFATARDEWSCRNLRHTALSSHVGCYTKRGNSICELPLSDLQGIVQTLEKGLWLRPQFAWQGARVGQICLTQLKERQRRFGTRDMIRGRGAAGIARDSSEIFETTEREKIFSEMAAREER